MLVMELVIVVKSTSSLWNPLCRVQFVIVIGFVAEPCHSRHYGGRVGGGYAIHLNLLGTVEKGGMEENKP